MNKKDKKEGFEDYKRNAKRLQAIQKGIEEDYIKKNTKYPVGAKVKLDNFNGEYDAEIIAYKIEKNGNVRPSFICLKTGKRIFDHNSKIRFKL